MVVGIVKIEFLFRGNDSLKGKRSKLNKIKERVRNKFNVSIAEVDYNDSLEYSILGFSFVGSDRSFINSMVDNLLNYISGLFIGEIVNSDFEMINV